MHSNGFISKYVLFSGIAYLLYVTVVTAVLLDDYFSQLRGKQLSNIFDTRQGLSKIRCTQACQSSILSHGCSGANFNTQTRECGLSNDVNRIMTSYPDADHLFAIILLGKCEPSEYLVSGPNGIPDGYLTASSIYPNHGAGYCAPYWARLNTLEMEVGKGAWSAATLDVNQWIQARFQSSKVVSGIALQGRDIISIPNHRQYVTEFKVSISTDCDSFSGVSNPDGSAMMFTGNTDTITIVTRMLPTPVTALCVRLHPTQWNTYISLRWDILGC